MRALGRARWASESISFSSFLFFSFLFFSALTSCYSFYIFFVADLLLAFVTYPPPSLLLFSSLFFSSPLLSSPLPSSLMPPDSSTSCSPWNTRPHHKPSATTSNAWITCRRATSQFRISISGSERFPQSCIMPIWMSFLWRMSVMKYPFLLLFLFFLVVFFYLDVIPVEDVRDEVSFFFSSSSSFFSFLCFFLLL